MPEQPKKRSAPLPAPHGLVQPAPHDEARMRRPIKRRKSFWKKAFEEVFDVIEDIFD